MGLKVVGCQHQDWDYERFLRTVHDNQPLWGAFKFVPEPDNEHDSRAVLVKYNGDSCGRVGAEFLDDVQLFLAAIKIMNPYMTEHSCFPRIGNVILMPNGKPQYFDLFLTVQVQAPSFIQTEIDKL